MAQVFGLELGELPEGWTPVEAVCIVKCVALDEDGVAGQKLSFRSTPGLTSWEVLGIFEGYATDLAGQFCGTLRGDDD